jgi:hypothetical protein
MKMWICRDKCGLLSLHTKKPVLFSTEDPHESDWYWVGEPSLDLKDLDMPEVTFENSPMEVELTLKSTEL